MTTPAYIHFIGRRQGIIPFTNTKYFLENSIPFAIHYPKTLYEQKAFSNLGYDSNSCPVSEKISKISQDEKLRKSIGKNGKEKYLKYFNSSLVAEFIINKCFDINNKNYYLWHNR